MARQVAAVRQRELIQPNSPGPYVTLLLISPGPRMITFWQMRQKELDRWAALLGALEVWRRLTLAVGLDPTPALTPTGALALALSLSLALTPHPHPRPHPSPSPSTSTSPSTLEVWRRPHVRVAETALRTLSRELSRRLGE